jgi:hypothetical protein
MPSIPAIDLTLFERQLQAFRSFVQEKSGVPFTSFAANPYTDEQEGYKADVYRAGRSQLAFGSWEASSIGDGSILTAAIRAVEVPENNLVTWQPRWGATRRPHQALYEARRNALFALYRSEEDEHSFNRLVAVIGKKYPLLAYLFFLKDRSKYLPIAPMTFDRAFELLGVDFRAANKCSFENYKTYLSVISAVKQELQGELQTDVSLLDAHSFTWMLARQMEREGRLANVDDILALSASEREELRKARVGQGQFRQALFDYWEGCSVTGCRQPLVLIASHMKPWSDSTTPERLNKYNGLLLSASLDKCFDGGLISFSDEGEIVISERLSMSDARLLGISSGMRLRRVEPKHLPFLRYHRALHGFR